MIQVDSIEQTVTESRRQGGDSIANERIDARQRGSDELNGNAAEDDSVVFVSPPPAPFPRVFPGL